MAVEGYFIPEPQYIKVVNEASNGAFLTVSHLETKLAGVDEAKLVEQREQALNDGDLETAISLDKKVNELHDDQRRLQTARETGEVLWQTKAGELLEERAENYEYVISAISSRKNTDPMLKTLHRLQGKVYPYIDDKAATDKLILACNKYWDLTEYTAPTKETVDRFVRTTVNDAIFSSDNSTEIINSIRFEEAMEAIFSRENPDVRDLDFVIDIIDGTKNKFVRSLALKKAVDIFRIYSETTLKVDVGGKLVSPSISAVYEDLTKKGMKMTKRDFLLTLPLVTKHGVIQEDLLQTVGDYFAVNGLRGGTPSEALYFTAVVDLFDPKNPTELAPLFEALQQEFRYKSSKYYAKLKEKNAQRKGEGRPVLDRYLSLGELRTVYKSMQHSLVSNLSYFKDIWKKLGTSEQNAFWEVFLAETILGMERDQITSCRSFEAIFKKLSALKLHDKRAIGDILGHLSGKEPHNQLAEINELVDSHQIELFKRLFDFTDNERAVLQTISNLPKGATLQGLDEQVVRLYKEHGDFNALLLLFDRYKQPVFDNVKPKELKDNLIPLLKEMAYHMVVGDFRQWRTTIPKDIKGNELHFFDKYPKFWQLWDRDDVADPDQDEKRVVETTKFKSPFKVNLAESLRETKDPLLRKLLDKPFDILLNPGMWSDEWMKGKAAKVGKKGIEWATNMHTLFEKIMQRDTETLKMLSIDPNNKQDKTKLERIIKMKPVFDAVVSLAHVLSDEDKMSGLAAFDEVSRLLKQVSLDANAQYFVSSKSMSEKDRQDSGLLAIKRLEDAIGTLQAIKKARSEGKISIADSSDPWDLLMVGQLSNTLINCMSYEGDPHKNAYVLDIATSRNKKVLKIQRNGKIVCRAVLKVMANSKFQASTSGVLILVDDDLRDIPLYSFDEEIKEHFKSKFKGMASFPYIKLVRGAKGQKVKQAFTLLENFERKRDKGEQLTEEETKQEMDLRGMYVLAYAPYNRVAGELVEPWIPGAPEFATPVSRADKKDLSKGEQLYSHPVRTITYLS